MDSLRPEPCVEGYSTPAGYSARAVKPIALAKVMAISQMIRREYGGKRSVSGIGGVETGRDAAEFILLGSSTVQARLAPPAENPARPSPARDECGGGTGKGRETSTEQEGASTARRENGMADSRARGRLAVSYTLERRASPGGTSTSPDTP